MRSRKLILISSIATISMALLMYSTNYSASALNFTVSILSGEGGTGEFSSPMGVTVSPDGTVFVADTDHFKIKKIANGVVSDFASIPTTDENDYSQSVCGIGVIFQNKTNSIWAIDCRISSALLFAPDGSLIGKKPINLDFQSKCLNCFDWGGGIALENRGGLFNGNIFLSDEHNNVILKFDRATGKTSVYAGIPGSGGSDNGVALKSTFRLPRGLALDSKGNLYVADLGNSAIRKITPDGITSTVQSLPCVSGVAVDSQDQVFGITEVWCGGNIYKVGRGLVTDDSKSINRAVNGAIIGQPRFAAQSGFAIDSQGSSPSNNMYIADLENHSIKMFSSDGEFIKKIGSEDRFGVTPAGTKKQIYMHPNSVFPLQDHTYLVVDTLSIRHINEQGEVMKVTRLEKSCWYPGGTAFLLDGTFLCAQGSRIAARFPDGTWMDIGSASESGNKDGNAATARFKSPEGMAMYKGGVLYFADAGNGQIKKLTHVFGSKDFQVTTVLGTGKWAGGGDYMERTKANFASPTRIAIGAHGNLYIADGGVDSIYKTSIESEGDVTRVGRGIGSWPSSITADIDGNVYVSGWGGKLFKISGNSMTYFAGDKRGDRLGDITQALFNQPTGLSIDFSGNLIIADRNNHQIKKININASPVLTGIPNAGIQSYLSASPEIPSGLTSQQEANVENKVIITNQTGLVAKMYFASAGTQPRISENLKLCDISIAKKLEYKWNSSDPLSSGICGVGRYVITYKGFITWPGTGKQLRTISTAADGGSYVKIADNVVVDQWNSTGGGSNFNYNKNSTLTLEGGRQYPIEVWYLSPQKGANASFNLLWSTVASGDPSTNSIIAEKYLSPSKIQIDAPLELPTKASTPKLTINLNIINLTVKVPTSASTVKLIAPEFGFTSSKPIIGNIRDGLATFEIALNSKYSGKKGTLQIITGNAVGDSSPLKVPVNVPKIISKPTPKVTPSAKPQDVQKQPEVTCMKGGIKRTFEGTACPPGYTKA